MSAIDILELKFEGNNVNPSTVKPSEIAHLIEDFEKALLSTIEQNHREINTEAVLFTFHEIKDESLGLRFMPKLITEIILSSYSIITTCINEGNFNQLNLNTIAALKSITKFSKRHNCIGYFKKNGITLSTFTATTEINFDKNHLVKGERTIYGKLIDVGGENPNIHLKVNDDYIIIITTDEKNAKYLATKLFEKVGLKGTAKWDAITSQIVDFKLHDIIDYIPGNVSNAFNEMKKLTSGFWDNFNNNDEINNHLFRDKI